MLFKREIHRIEVTPGLLDHLDSLDVRSFCPFVLLVECHYLRIILLSSNLSKQRAHVKVVGVGTLK